MKTKLFEIRDRATFIPVFAIEMDTQTFLEDERYLMRRAGFGTLPILIILGRLSGDGPCTADPHFWGNRTMKAAHKHITIEWERLHSGDVIDVEYILGEVKKPKRSERLD